MIFIWNRKEIYEGTSATKSTEIRNILGENKIKYTYKVINRHSSSVIDPLRSRTGTFGESLNYTYTYYIYVHKNDYDIAKGLINKI